ncbi:MAG: hypothetical protein H7A49_14265 [Akkermansiaceae bacterium]|nr:hypothetical protein [Akkermansiaceae bacterium]MCP5545058.1 hypothetical protein [Akkermansiaceae bacterium]MCP5546222.1 hypothetical protein [Akkermansiaceae bacterium]
MSSLRCRTLWLLALVAAPLAAQDEAPRAIEVAEPAGDGLPEIAGDRVVSKSGQFRVSGGDSLLRASVAMIAEQAKEELLHLTGEEDDWKVPVSIALHGQQGDPLPAKTVAMRLVIVDGVSELRLDLHLSRGIEQALFKHAVTAALLYERALKHGAGKDPERKLAAPPWLTEGLCEASRWRLNQSDRALYAALFKNGGLFKLEDLLEIDEREYSNLDGASRAAFRVSCGALTMALLEQPQGRDGFRAFLTEAAAFEGEMPTLLRRHFPELNLSETSLAKWWALQLANKGGLNPLTDILGIADTETSLAGALRLHFRTPEGIIQEKDLAAWPELADLTEQERALAARPAEEALVRLSYRCFPSYRPLLSEYQLVLADIVKGETKDVEQRLAGLAETRTTMAAKAERARDYLDWFEITTARTTSGAFDDYLRLKEHLKSSPRRTRKDSLSKYLDRMDAIFDRGLGAEQPAGMFGFGDLPPLPDDLPPLDLPPP